MAEMMYSPSLGGTVISFSGLNTSKSKHRFSFGVGPRFSPPHKPAHDVL